MKIDSAYVREHSDIVSIISQYIQLKPAGQGRLQGVCIFHRDRRPSLHVTAAKQLFICRVCQVGGDCFTFIQRAEGLDFPATVRRVAALSGIDTSQFEQEMDPQDEAKAAEDRKQVKQLMVEAEHWRNMAMPPSLWIYDKPATPQHILAAYQRAVADDPSLRQWIRDDIRFSREITHVIIGWLAQPKEDPFAWLE